MFGTLDFVASTDWVTILPALVMMDLGKPRKFTVNTIIDPVVQHRSHADRAGAAADVTGGRSFLTDFGGRNGLRECAFGSSAFAQNDCRIAPARRRQAIDRRPARISTRTGRLLNNLKGRRRMSARARFKGVFPRCSHNIQREGRFGSGRSKALHRFLIDAGSNGICILANYSEQFALADDERQLLMETVLDACRRPRACDRHHDPFQHANLCRT